ncbi:MAG TPA: sulfatase [Myxococcota bacterium]|nr:sulfatase [Myxococcota bacterium]
MAQTLLLLLLSALLTACGARPNIVVFVTDDQRHDSLDVMPNVQRLAAEGVLFREAFSPTPACGPARVAMLSGRLAAAQGVHVNEGAATAFDATRSIALHLQNHGYATALFGKYLNGYRDLFPAVPPGWSEWRVFRDGPFDLFKPGSIHVDPVLSWDGRSQRVTGYSTDLLGDYAVDFVERYARDPNPFFLMVAFSAPHVPLLPAARHTGSFAGRVPEPPTSIDETDLEDKPEFVREADVGELARAFWDLGHARTFEMLQSVDDAVGRVLDALEREGLSENTLVVFTSDNGFLFGEHGWVGKGVPYEESIRVPMVVRYPALTHGRGGRTSSALVSHLDLAPTFAALAGIPFDADGGSLAPLLVAPRLPWRFHIPLEFDATMGLQLGYRGVRLRHSKWVLWDDGRLEGYDLRRDPFELSGRLPRQPTTGS